MTFLFLFATKGVKVRASNKVILLFVFSEINAFIERQQAIISNF